MHDLLQKGIAAAQANRREEARGFLMQVIEADERNEQAWLWLAGVVDDPDDMRTCLENVLEINPNNVRARQGLEWVIKHYGGQMDAQNQGVSPVEQQAAPPTVSPQPQASPPKVEAASASSPPAPPVSVAHTYPCIYCGAATTISQDYCPQCRKDLMIRTAPREHRSVALAAMVVLSAIGSGLSILAGGLLFVAGILFSVGGEALKQDPMLMSELPPGAELPQGMDMAEFIDMLGGIIYGIALAFLIGGIFYIFVTRGLWRRRPWAYIVAIVFSVIGGLWSLFSLAIAIRDRTFGGSSLFELGLQGLMIALVVFSYRDFFGPMVRYLPKVEPTTATGHYNNGVAYKSRGMWYMATKEWEAAVQKSPTEVAYLHALGLAYAQMKQFAQARTILDRALSMAPNNPQLRDSRALIEEMSSSQIR